MKELIILERDNMQKTRGFTLIELMLVISIISLLSSLSFFSFTEARLKADDAHMKVETNSVRNAIMLYKDNEKVVPFNVDVIKGRMYSENTTEYKDSMRILVADGYLSEVPTSPSGNAYSYLVSDDGMSAVFAAKLNFGQNEANNSNNSCPIIKEEIYFDNCVGYDVDSIVVSNDSQNTGGLNTFCLSNCYDCEDLETGNITNIDFDPENQICINTSVTEVINYCSVEYDLDNSVCRTTPKDPNIDNGLCVNFSPLTDSKCVYRPSNELFVCEFVESESPPLCSGSSSNDYCGCIE